MKNYKPKSDLMRTLPHELFEYEKHNENSALYITARKRLCPGCPEGKNVHPLMKFFKHNHTQRYTTLCRACLDKEAESRLAAKTLPVLVDTLRKSSSDKNMSGGSFAEMMSDICAPMGGAKGASRKIGRLFNSCLNQALSPSAVKSDIDRGVKIGGVIINSTAVQEKNLQAAESNEYSEEFIFEKCIDLLATNKGLRARVINDPFVRRLLLQDLGVNVVEAVATKPEGHQLSIS